ncbi:MAG: DUF6446 family protein [Pseudomonadota bacterium]
MSGRLLLIGGAVLLLIFGSTLWYTQMYAFYEDLPDTGEITVAERTVPVDGFQGIDAMSSPIKLRACMTLDPGAFADLEPSQAAVPLVAPYWFDCFDARAIGKALESGAATAYLAASGEFHGSERMIAVFEDGRAFMWRQLSPEFSK